MGVPKITGPLRSRIFFMESDINALFILMYMEKKTNFEKQNDIKVI